MEGEARFGASQSGTFRKNPELAGIVETEPG